MREHDARGSGQEDGATAVEYALMVALIFLVIISAVALLGTNLSEVFANQPLSSALNG